MGQGVEELEGAAYRLELGERKRCAAQKEHAHATTGCRVKRKGERKTGHMREARPPSQGQLKAGLFCNTCPEAKSGRMGRRGTSFGGL